MSYTLRPASQEDLEDVLACWRESDTEPSRTDTVEGLFTLITRDPDALIVARAHQHVVGTVIAAWDGWRGSIYRLAVVPSERRKGLGRQLLHAAEERLAAAGAVRMQAVVVETDAQARAFWTASEWAQQVERLRFVRG